MIRANPVEGITHETTGKYFGHPFRWFWAILGPNRPKYVIGIAMDLLSIATSMAPAIIAGRLVDEVLRGGHVERLALYLGLLVGVPLARALGGVLYRYFFEIASQDTILRLRTGMYRHLQDLDGSYYDSADTGDIMARATGDMDMVRHFIAYTVYASFEYVTLFVVGTVYLFSLNWILALAAAVFSPLIGWLTYRLGKEIRPVWSEVRGQFAKLNTTVQQNIGGHRVVRAFARQAHETARFEVENEAYREVNVRSATIWIKYMPWLEGLSGFLMVPVLFIGGWLIILDQLTVGELVTFSGLLYVLSNPMRMAGWLMNEVQRFAASADKILELLMIRPRITSPVKDVWHGPVVGRVEFRDVSFAYSECEGQEPPLALRRVTFEAEAGWTIGILGATGSGKTSLVHLLSRFRDPTSGSVRVDGHDIRSCDLDMLRRSVGVVMQDVFLFSDTIEGNVAFGVPDAPEETVLRAARAADADGFIRRTPEGYDTIIGERGVGLSGGQRQRISLARALATDPRILVLDDTTSAVDMETEAFIQDALEAEYGDRTVFVVANRISSVCRADLILVLQDGEVAERGTHATLLALDGLYADMYRTQAGLSGRED